MYYSSTSLSPLLVFIFTHCVSKKKQFISARSGRIFQLTYREKHNSMILHTICKITDTPVGVLLTSAVDSKIRVNLSLACFVFKARLVKCWSRFGSGISELFPLFYRMEFLSFACEHMPSLLLVSIFSK